MNKLNTNNETFLYQPVMPNADAVRIGWMYPADDNIALSSLGYMTLFKQLDTNPNIDAERVYTNTLKQHNANRFELMGFSFSFELDVVKILETLEFYNIPLYAKDRTADHPLVFAGGPVPITNPEPYADFFDFFLIGEGEEVLEELVTAYRQQRNFTNREAFLRHLAATVPGCYVPSLYQVSYTADNGAITEITPKYPDVPAIVNKRLFSNMEQVVASSPVVTPDTIFSSTFLVEVMRGCAHRCRFCLASYSMLPARGPSLEPVKQAIEAGLKHTNKIGLLGALIADHPNFDELCQFLNHHMDTNPDMEVTAASLRADTVTEPMVKTFVRGKQGKITIAIESGSERLRRRINKNLKQDAIIRCAETAKKAGLKSLKLYGMVGLPDETEEDVLTTIELLKTIRQQVPKLKLVLGSSSFVPKAATPFQWQQRLDNKTVDSRFKLLEKGLRKVAAFRPSSTKWDYFQAFLSRGDRRLAPLLVRFYQLGGSLGSLKRAYKELKAEGLANFPEPDWYALRERPEGEILPWDMINLGVDKHILYKEGLPPPGFGS